MYHPSLSLLLSAFSTASVAGAAWPYWDDEVKIKRTKEWSNIRNCLLFIHYMGKIYSFAKSSIVGLLLLFRAEHIPNI